MQAGTPSQHSILLAQVRDCWTSELLQPARSAYRAPAGRGCGNKALKLSCPCPRLTVPVRAVSAQTPPWAHALWYVRYVEPAWLHRSSTCTSTLTVHVAQQRGSGVALLLQHMCSRALRWRH